MRTPTHFARATLATLAILSVAGLSVTSLCRRVGPAGEGGGAMLMTNLLRARELEIVVEEHALQEPLERAALLLRGADPAVRFDAHVVEGASTKASRVPRLVVGTRNSRTAQALVAHAGVQVVGDPAHAAFSFAGQEFADPRDAAIATFEDPDRPGLPVTVVFANDAAVAVRLCSSVQPAWKPWTRVVRAGDVVLSGPNALDGAPRIGDLARPGVARRARDSELEIVATAVQGLDVRAPKGSAPEAIARYGEECRAARERTTAWCSPGAPLPVQALVQWSRPEDYLVDGDPDALSRFDPVDMRVDALVLGTLTDGGAAVACAGAYASLGEPSQPWMRDACGVEAAWKWWGRDLDAWLARTSTAGVDLDIARLVSAHAGEAVSNHVLAPRRAALWRFLRETRGDLCVRELWRGTRGLETLGDLDAAFSAWIQARLVAAHLDHPRRREQGRAPAVDAQPMRGIATCTGDADDRRGPQHAYGTRAFESDLDAARASGADALLVTSFTRDEPGLAPLFGDAAARTFAPREGDVRLVAALLAGSARGMRTLLAPHLVSGDGGSWSGAWTRSDQASWTAFFERYRRFVEHHAFVAELGGAHVLSIGTGLWAVTGVEAASRRTNPAESEWKRAGWTRVIEAARAAYPGLLTYSAGNGQELEDVPFFGALDLVGFGLSPVLADRDARTGRNVQPDHDPREEILRWVDSALAGLERVARANGRRALLTQVCFSPNLHGVESGPDARPSSREWQAQQFRDLTDRLHAWSGRPLLAGVFAWRVADDAEPRERESVITTKPVFDAVRDLLKSL